MNLRLDFLIQKLLKNTLTSDEHKELQGLIRSGSYEQEIKNLIGEELLMQFQTEKTWENDFSNADQIFENIVRHWPESKPELIPFWKRLPSIGIAAALVLGLGLGWHFYQSPAQPALGSLDDRTVLLAVETKEQQKFIKLPDGSKVQLNKNSELLYDSLFGETREVILKGEAFFDIAHDPDHPFKVRTGKVVTKVLGTAFNINASGADVIIAVTRGLVEVGDENRIYALIHPKEKISVNVETQLYRTATTALKDELTWKAGTLVIDELTMEQAADTLSRLYHKNIEIMNPRIADCRVSGTFLNNESFEDILTLVFGSRQASFRIAGDKVIIEGGLECE